MTVEGERTPEQYTAELRALGFPDRAMREAVVAHRAGLFALEPAPDLPERIAAACAVLHVPPRRIPRIPAAALAVLGTLLAMLGLVNAATSLHVNAPLLAVPLAAGWFVAFEAYVNPHHRDRSATWLIAGTGLAVSLALLAQGFAQLH